MLFPLKASLAKSAIEKAISNQDQKHESIRHYITLSNISKHLDLNTIFQYTDKHFLSEMLNNEQYSNYLHPLVEKRQDIDYWKKQVKFHLKSEHQALKKLSGAINILKSNTIEQHQRVKLLTNLKPKLSRISNQILQQLDHIDNPQQLKNLYLNHTTSIEKLNQALDSIEDFFDRTHGDNHIERLKSFIFSSLD